MLELLPLILQLVLQALDIAVHAATDQIEPLRVASNAVLGLAALVAARSGRFARPLLVGASVAYLALNIWFLFQFGLVNPNTGGVRYPLFVFVFGSLALAAWQWRGIDGSRNG
ncbi:MAG: hypothetical protein AAFZ11_15180 [Pseudomonadota bacterium]